MITVLKMSLYPICQQIHNLVPFFLHRHTQVFVCSCLESLFLAKSKLLRLLDNCEDLCEGNA